MATTIEREAIWTIRAGEELQFDSRTRRSAELAERARRSMPDGVPMAWMAGLYGHRPIFVAHADGCRFTDVDGMTYLDFNQADLSATSGFAPPAVLKAIAERAARGLQFLLPVEEAIEAAELLAERYGLPAWQFTLSASGANAEAIRLARHRTGREAIVVFGGHYHGHLDDTLVTGDEHAARAELLGLNQRAAAGARIVPFNDLAALERVLAREEVAAVITEPALTNVGIVLRTTASSPPSESSRGHTEACSSSTRPIRRRSPTAGSRAPGDSSPTSSRSGRAPAAASPSAPTA